MKSVGTLLSESGYVSSEDLDSFIVFDDTLGDFSEVCKCYRLSPAASTDTSSSPGKQQGPNNDKDRKIAPMATDMVLESDIPSRDSKRGRSNNEDALESNFQPTRNEDRKPPPVATDNVLNSKFPPEDSKLGRGNNEDRKLPPVITDEVLESHRIPANDIKLGRGKPLQSHPGNIWFRKRVARELPEYDRLGDQQKKQKVDMKKNIYQSITSTSRKFWKAHKERKGFWRMAGEACVLEKIAYSLRSERKKKKEEDKRKKKEKERARQSSNGRIH